jgi:hypothetical protein
MKLQKRLDTDTKLSDKQRVKIMNKITRLRKDFMYAGMETTDDKKMFLFITNFGRQILVDDYKIVFSTKPKIPTSPVIPYLLAYGIMLLLFMVASVLNLFGIISDGLVLASSFVLCSAGVVLNVWTLIDSRKLWKKYKFIFVLNALAILMNGFNVYQDILQMIG